MGNTINSYLRGVLLAHQQAAQIEQLLAARQSRQIQGQQEQRAGEQFELNKQRSEQDRLTEELRQQQLEQSLQLGDVNFQVAQQNLERIKGQTELFKDPTKFNAAVDEALKDLGDLDSDEKARVNVAKRKDLLSKDPSLASVFSAVDSIVDNRSIGKRMRGGGNIIPDPKSPTGYSKQMFDASGQILAVVPALPPASMLPKVTESEAIVVDDKGNIYRVPKKTLTTPLIPGGGQQPPAKPSKGAAPAAGGKIEQVPTGQDEQAPNLGLKDVATVSSPKAQALRGRSAQLVPGITKLSAGTKEKLDLALGLLDDVNIVESLMEGREDLFGPVAGRVAGGRIKYAGVEGENQFALDDPEAGDLFAVMVSLQDSELRRRSGAQINEQEFQRMLKFTPDPTVPASTNKRRLEQFKRQIVSYIERVSGRKLESKPAANPTRVKEILDSFPDF